MSLGLLGIAAVWIDWKDVLHRAIQLEVVFLALPLLLGVCAILIGALKWHLLLKVIGLRVEYIRVVGLVWMGSFFNNFLPGRTGGDLVRAYSLSRGDCSSSEAVVSIVLDRALNLAALIPLMLLALSLNRQSFPIALSPATPQWVAIALVVSLGTAFSVWRLRRTLKRSRFWRFLAPIASSVSALVQRPRVMVASVGLAVLYQSAMVTSHYGVGRALGLSLDLTTYFCLVPLTVIVSLLPITLNGLGLREGAFALLFVQVGVSPDTAVALSLLAVGITAAVSLVGGIWYVTSGLRSIPDGGRSVSSETSSVESAGTT